MKFKSPTETPVYVALLSGHAAVVGDEFRDLPPNLHRKALELGCITDNMDAETINARIQEATPNTSNHAILVGIIKNMAANPKEGDFVASTNLPNLKRLAKSAGWSVSREEMMQAVQAIANEDEEDDAA